MASHRFRSVVCSPIPSDLLSCQLSYWVWAASSSRGRHGHLMAADVVVLMRSRHMIATSPSGRLLPHPSACFPFTHLPKADLLVFWVWSIFSHDPKR